MKFIKKEKKEIEEKTIYSYEAIIVFYENNYENGTLFFYVDIDSASVVCIENDNTIHIIPVEYECWDAIVKDYLEQNTGSGDNWNLTYQFFKDVRQQLAITIEEL